MMLAKGMDKPNIKIRFNSTAGLPERDKTVEDDQNH